MSPFRQKHLIQKVKHKLVFISMFLFYLVSNSASAQRQEFALVLKNHLFYPAEITIPANKKIRLIIENQDSSIEEFDSFSLNREKYFSQNKKL